MADGPRGTQPFLTSLLKGPSLTSQLKGPSLTSLYRASLPALPDCYIGRGSPSLTSLFYTQLCAEPISRNRRNLSSWINPDFPSNKQPIDKLSIWIAQSESKCQYSPRFTRNTENWPTSGGHRTTHLLTHKCFAVADFSSLKAAKVKPGSYLRRHKWLNF
jgi:hypothetical protein